MCWALVFLYHPCYVPTWFSYFHFIHKVNFFRKFGLLRLLLCPKFSSFDQIVYSFLCLMLILDLTALSTHQNIRHHMNQNINIIQLTFAFRSLWISVLFACVCLERRVNMFSKYRLSEAISQRYRLSFA